MTFSIQRRGRAGRALILPLAFAGASLLSAAVIAASPAAAQWFGGWFDDDRPRHRSERAAGRGAGEGPRAARKVRERRDARERQAPGQAEGAKPKPPVAARAEAPKLRRPLFAVVSINNQRVSIYNHDGLVVRSAVSTGIAGHPTPRGVFTIIGRERYHHSNIYSGAPMPFMQRVTWSGIAMHLGVVPGHPASHGCIRLPAGFAAQLWGMTRIGERVVISREDTEPAEFSHPSLPVPKMRPSPESNAPAPAASAPSAEPGAAPASAAESAQPAAPATLNPHQYAERLKAKAAADAAAAAKAVKETLAALGAKQAETARATSEVRAAENALAQAQARADATARAFDVAAGAERAARDQAAEAGAEVRALETTASAGKVEATKARAERQNKVVETMMAAKDAAQTAKSEAATALADAAARLDAAKKAAAPGDAETAEADRRWREATAAADAAVVAAKEAERRATPVSVLVSKKDRKVYVRQALAPMFDAPVTVRDPETPLGSHLYIATAATDDGAALKWSVVSMPESAIEPPVERKRRTAAAGEVALTPPGPPSGPAEALERIEMAPDVRDRIGELLWTGGSIIISDQPPSVETGAVGTDLTIKVR